MNNWDGTSVLVAGMYVGYFNQRVFLVGKSTFDVWVIERDGGGFVSVTEDKLSAPPSAEYEAIYKLSSQILQGDPSIGEAAALLAAEALYRSQTNAPVTEPDQGS